MDLVTSASIALMGCGALAVVVVVMRTCGALLTGIAIGMAVMLLLTNPQLLMRAKAAVATLVGYLAPDDSTAGRLRARLQQFL